MHGFTADYLSRLGDRLQEIRLDEIEQVGERLVTAFHSGVQVLIAGNGGSAANASHLACDLAKTVLGADPQSKEKRFRVVCICDNIGQVTAWANDVGYDAVFAEQVKMLGRPGDLLLLLSVSGNSENLVKAAQAARIRELVTVAFLGSGGGALRDLVDDYVLVPSADFGVVESAHVALGHLLTAWLGLELHGNAWMPL